MPQHLEQTHHGHLAHVREQDGSFGLEMVTPESEHVEIPRELPQPVYQLGRIPLARGLATRDQDPPSGRAHHLAAV